MGGSRIKKWVLPVLLIASVFGVAAAGIASDCTALRQRVAVLKQRRGYATSYANTHHQLQQALVIEYPVYYQVGAGLRQEAQEEAIAERIYQRLLQRLEQETGGMPGANMGENLTPAESIFQARCTSCHGDERAEGGLRLTPDALSTIDTPRRWHIFGRALDGSMPPSGDKVTDDELETLSQWRDSFGSRPD